MSLDARRTVLIVDDEVNLRKVLEAMLRREGYHVLTASDGQEALERLAKHPVDLVLTDLRMPKLDGMSLLRQVLAEYTGIPVIILTAHGTVDNAVEAMKLGAFDFLTKPFDKDELRVVVHKAAATAELNTAEPQPSAGSRHGLIGNSPRLQAVFKMIEKVSGAPSTVLITGESGTGKELVASAIHVASPRKDKPFIRINCAAIPRDLIESELFGYERGAFTGAVASKPGRFELADAGTLFLDEIGEIPMEMQVKLLRALQESEFERVGGVTTTHVDVRLIAATNRDLRAEITAGKFREDLFHRLNVVPIELPPLRERTEDIPLLVDHFRQKYNKRLAKDPPIERLTEGAVACLMTYAWPGNIRELENVMERAMLFAEGGVITPDELPDQLRRAGELSEPEQEASPEQGRSPPPAQATPIGPLKEIVRLHTESLEKDLITRALEETGGNVTQAARKLAISRKSLQNKMKELKLREPSDDDGVDSNPPH
ncbi:MAG: sigma-54-dependent Fis family transcriptional regulator [Deltaproteobacteria bacterium]|nr:sigma-54-dependent Fis family transcriptional regulator [Deltaproteobacteria bacterium]